MKQIQAILQLSMVLLLFGCSKDEHSAEQDAQVIPLSFVVNVSNRQGDAASVPAKAISNSGYTTTFSAGDAIGIFASENGVQVYTNKKWVYNGILWSPATDADKILYSGKPLRIKAYYPYNPTATELPAAETFMVQANQSTLEAFTASDLLLSVNKSWYTGPWVGGAAADTLYFTHAMAMVEVIPSIDTDLQEVSLAAAAKQGALPTSISLYRVGDGSYRALIPPQDLSTKLWFTYSNQMFSYATMLYASAGEYRSYSIITFPPKLGYYWYADGSYSEVYSDTKACIGVVVREKSSTKSGLVLSLDEEKLGWGPSGVVTGASSEDSGATNLAAIKNNSGWEVSYPAFAWCDAKSSSYTNYGWYLPAVNELLELYAVRSTVSPKLTNAGGVALSTTTNYMSSSERDDSYVTLVSLANGAKNSTAKTNSSMLVRAVFTF